MSSLCNVVALGSAWGRLGESPVQAGLPGCSMRVSAFLGAGRSALPFRSLPLHFGAGCFACAEGVLACTECFEYVLLVHGKAETRLQSTEKSGTSSGCRYTIRKVFDDFPQIVSRTCFTAIHSHYISEGSGDKLTVLEMSNRDFLHTLCAFKCLNRLFLFFSATLRKDTCDNRMSPVFDGF